MANDPAPALGLREGDREELVRLARSSSVRAGLTQRARIVLLAAEGLSNTTIAEEVVPGLVELEVAVPRPMPSLR